MVSEFSVCFETNLLAFAFESLRLSCTWRSSEARWAPILCAASRRPGSLFDAALFHQKDPGPRLDSN